MFSRRSMLKGAAALPIGVRAAKAEIQNALESPSSGMIVNWGSAGDNFGPEAQAFKGGVLLPTPQELALEYIKKHGFPEELKQEIRNEVNYGTPQFDHDIAIKCWSHSVKVATQRERNYQRAIEYRMKQLGPNLRQKLKDKMGFWWPF